MDAVSSQQIPSMTKTNTRTSKKGELTTPIFLRKAFDMISTCDPSLASWSDQGTTFVIKEPELFASQIIPSYFKHSNLSSFVRQLNFYGFRKIKSDPLRLQDAALSEEKRFWKFGHRFFIQDREDLLSQIKKDKDKSDAGSADKAEFDKVKQENDELKRKVSALTQDVDELKAIVPSLMQQIELVIKKQKTAHVPSSLTPYPIGPPLAPSQNGIHCNPITFQEDAFESDDFSIGALDQDLLLSLYDNNETSKTAAVTTKVLSSVGKPTDPQTTAFADELRESLSRLPPDMQTLFVDRMVGLLCCPQEMQRQINAVTSLPTLAKNASRIGIAKASPTNMTDERKIIPYGSGLLDSFLSKGTKHQLETVTSMRSLTRGESISTLSTLARVGSISMINSLW